MSITVHRDLIQGSDEWLAARCGLVCASEVKLLLTPTLKTANNDKTRAHIYELLAQRITGYVEPQYVSDDMLRGRDDEIEARNLYAQRYAPVETMGFITREFATSEVTFTVGFSPDGLVGEEGFIEVKSRRQRLQVETIVNGSMPADFLLQVQTGFFVTGRKWCDFLSYSGGLPMEVIRIYPDEVVIEHIIEAVEAAELQIADLHARYLAAVSERGLVPTERRVEEEMIL